MELIIKIEEYLPETNKIIVKVSRLRSQQLIENCIPWPVNLNRLDTYDLETFTQSLIKTFGNSMLKEQESREPIVNNIDIDEATGEFDVENLVGKVIKCKTNTRKVELLKVRKVEL
tara:strand:+ start:4527 stop:4874 length:348 start_codon:yes stop_codon:yes gene_type:complete